MRTISFYTLAIILLVANISNVNAAESVQQKLDARKAEFLGKAPKDKIDIYERGVETVSRSGAINKALKVGDKAPDFSLLSATSETVTLSELLKKGPVVMTWYRGGWCPYCNIYLQHLKTELLPELKKHKGTLVALSPELPDHTLSTKEKLSLPFEVLTDQDNKVAKKYGIVYKLPKEVSVELNKFALLKDYNGNESDELPLAVTYVVQPSGIISYAFVDGDYRKRAETADILKGLEHQPKN